MIVGTRFRVVAFLIAAAIPAVAQKDQVAVPKIWDDKALEDWATPIAALGVRPGHFTSAEYYAAPGDNLKTYPVYFPDREPPEYWEWLQKQKPQPLIDVSKLHTREDWVRAGENVFRILDKPDGRTSDPAMIQAFRDPGKYERVYMEADGTLLSARWVVTNVGVQLSTAACMPCHARLIANENSQLGEPLSGIPGDRAGAPVPVRRLPGALHLAQGDPIPLGLWRQFTTPWALDERIENLRSQTEDGAMRAVFLNAGPTAPRTHGSPFYATKTPDLHPLHYNRYLDATGTHRLRGPEDVARYAAFVSGSDPMEFGRYKILEPEQRRVFFRYADEVLYAIGMYLMALESPRNPDTAPADLVARGREIFVRETGVNCHVPPNYTSGKLTLAAGFTPPENHPNKADIVNISVDTERGLATKTRKGTGFYKILPLRGVWSRPALLHDGSAASLEEMFDPDRLKPNHVPGGWKGPALTNRGIPGHRYGLGLDAQDKKALLAFLRSL
jgi:hypothetical protein